MKPLVLFCTLLASAGPALAVRVGEPPIPAREIRRVARIAAEARDAHAISPAEYAETLRRLHARPCRGVERALTAETQRSLAPAIARQQNATTVAVRESFALGRWRIVGIDNNVSDAPYLFYAADPAVTMPLAAWGGGATIFETADIERWTREHAPGIPPTLARCFAWHVTLNRS